MRELSRWRFQFEALVCAGRVRRGGARVGLDHPDLAGLGVGDRQPEPSAAELPIRRNRGLGFWLADSEVAEVAQAGRLRLLWQAVNLPV